MIVLKKENHYEHTYDPAKASDLVKEGFEVIKGASYLAKADKSSKAKKNPLLKRKKK